MRDPLENGAKDECIPASPHYSRIPFTEQGHGHGRRVRVESISEIQSLPKGAVRITREEVLEAALKISSREEYKDINSFYEYWPLVCGATSIFTSAYLISIVRHKFKLGVHHARGIHYTLGTAIPALATPYIHVGFVQQPAIIKEVPCQECLAVRSGLVQSMGSFVWPAIMSVVGSFYYARRYYTVPLPPLKLKHINDFKKIIVKPFKPVGSILLLHIALQFVVGYMAGMKFWAVGQELDVVENMIGFRDEELSIYKEGTSLKLAPARAQMVAAKTLDDTWLEGSDDGQSQTGNESEGSFEDEKR